MVNKTTKIALALGGLYVLLRYGSASASENGGGSLGLTIPSLSFGAGVGGDIPLAEAPPLQTTKKEVSGTTLNPLDFYNAQQSFAHSNASGFGLGKSSGSSGGSNNSNNVDPKKVQAINSVTNTLSNPVNVVTTPAQFIGGFNPVNLITNIGGALFRRR